MVVAFLAAAGPVSADEPQEVLISGSGRGHGVGMSQWGAKGQADAGKSAEEILTHYYTGGAYVGTLDEQLPAGHRLLVGNHPTWVNVRRSVGVLEFAAIDGDLTVCTAALGCVLTARPGESWRFETLGNGNCRFVVDGVPVTDPAQCSATVKGMAPGGATLNLAGGGSPANVFARGHLKIRSPDQGLTFHVLVALAFEDYVLGVSEVPFSWPTAALEAQAIAARSFGAFKNLLYDTEANFTEQRKQHCWCHVFADTNDQVYRGWGTEIAPSAARWISAVQATRGMVVLHPDARFFDVAETFYSAANGGATENSEDVFITALPWLRSIDDPWTPGAAGNPYASWEHGRSEAEIAAALSVDEIDGLRIVSRFESGTPSRIDILTRTGQAKGVTRMRGNELAALLGLTGRHVKEFTFGSIEPGVGDFDGDGVTDVTMLLGFNAAWWVGEAGAGSFAMSPWANLDRPDGWGAPLVGDFTGDGRDDAAIYNTVTGRWKVGRAIPGGSFGFSRWGTHRKARAQWTGATVGDFDGDGLADIADYNPGTGRVRVFRSTGTSFESAQWHRFAEPRRWDEVLAGDYDGDGRDDVAFVDASSGAVTVLFSQGATFRARAWATLPALGAPDVLTADVTGDGRDDLVAHDALSGDWTVATAGRTRRASSVSSWAQTSTTWSMPTAGDYSGDGADDVAVFDTATGWWTVLVADGGSFGASRWGRNPAPNTLTDSFAHDHDGDGDADLLVWAEGRRKWWRAVSDGESFAVAGAGRLLP